MPGYRRRRRASGRSSTWTCPRRRGPSALVKGQNRHLPESLSERRSDKLACTSCRACRPDRGAAGKAYSSSANQNRNPPSGWPYWGKLARTAHTVYTGAETLPWKVPLEDAREGGYALRCGQWPGPSRRGKMPPPQKAPLPPGEKPFASISRPWPSGDKPGRRHFSASPKINENQIFSIRAFRCL